DAVHHDVILADATQTGATGGGGVPAIDARNKSHQTCKVPADDRQTFDLFLLHRERTFTALRLHQGHIRAHRDGFRGGAHFERHWRYTDAIAAAHYDPRASQQLKRWRRHLNGVRVGGHVGEHIVAAVIRKYGGAPRRAQLADESHVRTGYDSPARVDDSSGYSAGCDLG